MIIAPGFVGIDVSKAHLDVFDAAVGTPIRLANTPAAVAGLARERRFQALFALQTRRPANYGAPDTFAPCRQRRANDITTTTL
jgi:hypothetical protein